MKGHNNDNNNNSNNGHRKKVRKGRVIALLNREEMEFLDRLAMDSLFSTGSKLSRVEILSALVEVGMVLDISGKGVSNKKELVHKILEALQDYPDRRKYPRLKKNLVVRFRKIDSTKDYGDGKTVDIGVGGFKVDVAFLGKNLSSNQPIEIDITDPRDASDPVKAIGRIVWVKNKEDGHTHEIGIMLTYIKEKDRDRFMDYLYWQSENLGKND